MTTVLQGAHKAIHSYISENYTASSDLVLPESGEIALPFSIVRAVVAALRPQIGDAAMDTLLHSHKTYLSILYGNLVPSLDEKELKLQSLGKARLDSNITHSHTAKAALTQACAQLLIQLHETREFQLIVPNVSHLDINSIDLLKFMYQVYPEKSPRLVLGYNPDWENDHHDRISGISWYYSLDTVTIAQSFIYAFERMATTVTKIYPGDTTPVVTVAQVFQPDKYDDGAEWNAHCLLRNEPLSLNPETAVQVMAGIQKCFHLFDFTNALLLGLKAQQALEPFISKEEKAILLHIIGLSAHNRHFFTQGNLPLANYLQQTFEKALAYETHPARRVALLYRLIVTLSRRKNDTNSAIAYVNQAYEELNAFSGIYRDLLFGWIKNVHSYIVMKEGGLPAAIKKHEEAYYLLLNLSFDPLEAPADEIAYTKAVLAENLSTLNSLLGNFKEMERWYGIETAYTDTQPSLSAISSAEWQSFYYQQLKIRQALVKAEQGLKKTREGFNYILEYFFTLSLAEIHNRLGDTDKATAYYESCLIFQKKIGHSYTQISPYALQVALAKVALSAGRYPDALNRLSTLNTLYPELSIPELLEIKTQEARCYAYLEKGTEAEECINAAIEIALREGDCGGLFTVTLAAAQVCQVLGRTTEAQTAYRQALELSKTSVDDIPYKASNADLATLYLGLLETGDTDMYLVTELTKNLANALRKNADSWWHLQSWLRLVSQLPEETKNTLAENPFHKAVIEAASQRPDCAFLLPKPIKELSNKL